MKSKTVIILLVIAFMLSACNRTTSPVTSSNTAPTATFESNSSSADASPPVSFTIDPSLWGKEVNIPWPNNDFSAQDFTGTWSRTNTLMALSASIEITNQQQYSFDFSFTGFWAAHSGELDATAVIVSPTEAKYSMYYSDGVETITFNMKDHLLVVTADPDASFALGFGANVTIGGSYVSGAPTYINANIVDDVFKTSSMKAKVQSLLGDSVYQDVIEVMQQGFEMNQANTKDKLNYSGFENGVGWGVDIKLDSNKIYIGPTP